MRELHMLPVQAPEGLVSSDHVAPVGSQGSENACRKCAKMWQLRHWREAAAEWAAKVLWLV